jgi:hypothetical protein
MLKLITLLANVIILGKFTYGTVKTSRATGGLDRATIMTFFLIGVSSLCYIVFFFSYLGTDFTIILEQNNLYEEVTSAWMLLDNYQYFKAIYYMQFFLDNAAFAINLSRW